MSQAGKAIMRIIGHAHSALQAIRSNDPIRTRAELDAITQEVGKLYEAAR